MLFRIKKKNQARIALPSYRWTCWMLVSQVNIRRWHKGFRVHCWHIIQEVGSKPKKTAPTDIGLQPAMTGVSQKLSRQRGDNISGDLPTMVRTAWTWTRKYWPEPGKVQICHAKSGLRPTYTYEPQLSIQKACRVRFFSPPIMVTLYAAKSQLCVLLTSLFITFQYCWAKS